MDNLKYEHPENYILDGDIDTKCKYCWKSFSCDRWWVVKADEHCDEWDEEDWQLSIRCMDILNEEDDEDD